MTIDKTILAIAVLIGATISTASALRGELYAAPKRVAVVVGANAAAPGRKPLRFAHDDAAAVAAVLKLTGVKSEDIALLRDPHPDEVLAALDTALLALKGNGSQPAEDSVLFFYYSGHADAESLFPAGKALKLAALRDRLDSQQATVRIGIIDACRGGGWTGTKGLSETEAFAVNIPLNLASEGSVLISSSSGLEDAHESASLRGSFFTHHWSAGLRGAADDNQDGTITLAEAFKYARVLTIRDTSIHTENPQHPSFQMKLRGKGDIDLVTALAKASSLTVTQAAGPLQLVHLDSGVVVLELPKGKRVVSLILPSGPYMVRRRGEGGTYAREISVVADTPSTVNENQLQPHEDGTLMSKGFEPKTTPSFLRKGDWKLQFGLGISHEPIGIAELQTESGANTREASGTLRVLYGITDRWQLELTRPVIAYRGGHEGSFEWMPKVGLLGWGLGGGSNRGTYFIGVLGAGIDTRLWLRPTTSVSGELVASTQLGYSGGDGFCSGEVFQCPDGDRSNWYAPGTLTTAASIGISHEFDDLLTLNVGVGLRSNVLFDGGVAKSGSDRMLEYSIGSVQSRGFSPLPLLELHLSESFSLFGEVQIRRNLETKRTSETYLSGVIWRW